jgi:hypothetical protein
LRQQDDELGLSGRLNGRSRQSYSKSGSKLLNGDIAKGKLRIFEFSCVMLTKKLSQTVDLVTDISDPKLVFINGL